MMGTANAYEITTENVGADFAEATLTFLIQDLLTHLTSYIQSQRAYETKHKKLLDQYVNLEDIPSEQKNELEELNRLKADLVQSEKKFMAQKKPLRDLLFKEFSFLELKEDVLNTLAESSRNNEVFKNIFSVKDRLTAPLPLNMEIFFQNIGMAEIVKNALDALIITHIRAQSEKERSALPVEVKLTIRLSIQGPSLKLSIIDNGGGFPEKYLNETNGELSQTDRKKRLQWLTNTHDSDKKADVKPYFFGGHGLGMRLIFGWMLDGVNVEGRGKYRQLYDFKNRPDISVTLNNVRHADGQTGACLTLESPITPIVSLVDTEVINITLDSGVQHLDKKFFWSTSRTPSPFSDMTTQSPDTKGTDSSHNMQDGDDGDQNELDEFEQITDDNEASPFPFALPTKSRNSPKEEEKKVMKRFFTTDEKVTENQKKEGVADNDKDKSAKS